MYGADIGELIVFKRGLNGGTIEYDSTVWYLSDEQSVNETDWKYGQVGLSDRDRYQVGLVLKIIAKIVLTIMHFTVTVRMPSRIGNCAWWKY